MIREGWVKMSGQVSDSVTVWQAWPSTRPDYLWDKKQGYGMTNPDPKCPVMRRRPLPVTFGPQGSAGGVVHSLQCTFAKIALNYSEEYPVSFVPSGAVKYSTTLFSFL